MEALKCCEANLTVFLQPSKTTNVLDAIKRELSSSLFKYNETYQGVLLAYDFVVLSNLAKMLSLYPYIGVSLKANLLLFDPKPETYLEGKVEKLARESIHIIVLGFSAATISEEDIRDEFKFKIKHGREVFRSTSNRRHVIKVGTVIRFFVKSFDEETLHISGSLTPPTTGSLQWLSKNSEEMPIRNSQRRTDPEGVNEEVCAGTVDGGALSNEYHVLKKPKKQRVA